MGDVTFRQGEVIVLDYSIFIHNGHMPSVIFIFAIDLLTLKGQKTTIAKFANAADPDETAHHELSHLDLQCLPSSL